MIRIKTYQDNEETTRHSFWNRVLARFCALEAIFGLPFSNRPTCVSHERSTTRCTSKLRSPAMFLVFECREWVFGKIKLESKLSMGKT